MGITVGEVLKTVRPRLRELRRRRGMTLVGAAERIGVNESTLSRLEGGIRKPTLELLLPLAYVYAVPLDELIGAPRTGDPRIQLPRTGARSRKPAWESGEGRLGPGCGLLSGTRARPPLLWGSHDGRAVQGKESCRPSQVRGACSLY